jgi:hypothetical protein
MGDNIKKNEKRSTYRALVGKPKGNRPLEDLRSMWEDNNKNGSSRNRMGRYGLAADSDWWAVLKTVRKLQVP